MTARGLRNKNPLNIDKGADWQGLTPEQPDSRFCTFIAPEWGYRAAVKILLRYQSAYGLETVRQIIHRWAPPSENDTGAYANAVSEAMGISTDLPVRLLDSPTLLQALLRAMTIHENGSCPYSDTIIQQGMLLAGVEHVHNATGVVC